MCGLTLNMEHLHRNEGEAKENDENINYNQEIRELSSLTIDEVSNLLIWANMSMFVEIFRERRIDGLTLSSCEELSDIQECGVDIKPKAKSFLKHVINFKANGVPKNCLVGKACDGRFENIIKIYYFIVFVDVAEISTVKPLRLLSENDVINLLRTIGRSGELQEVIEFVFVHEIQGQHFALSSSASELCYWLKLSGEVPHVAVRAYEILEPYRESGVPIWLLDDSRISPSAAEEIVSNGGSGRDETKWSAQEAFEDRRPESAPRPSAAVVLPPTEDALRIHTANTSAIGHPQPPPHPTPPAPPGEMTRRFTALNGYICVFLFPPLHLSPSPS